jgi:hypothetical protein
MPFDTEVTLSGPWRQPAQMLAEQDHGGHASIHDGDTASSLGLTGAPIEGPTHFSQFDPLAFLLWGQAWFERGCISCHFRTMVVEGEEVQATLASAGGSQGVIEAKKTDGTPVLTGTVAIGPDYGTSELERRRASAGAPGDLFVIDQLELGMREEGDLVAITHDGSNGAGYPFSLAEKLDRITEPHPWYTPEGGAKSPWGVAVVPMEMVSVLAYKTPPRFPVRTPYMGLFLDLEVRILDGPVRVDREYSLSREIVGLGQSRRTESYWTLTTVTDEETGRPTAEVLLHSGVFKESYPGYPAELLKSPG